RGSVSYRDRWRRPWAGPGTVDAKRFPGTNCQPHHGTAFQGDRRCAGVGGALSGAIMSSPLRRLSRQYAAAFLRYLAEEQEAILQEAYELGREAIARGLGVMDMARVHQWALTSCLASAPGEMRSCALNAAESFFLETLS